MIEITVDSLIVAFNRDIPIKLETKKMNHSNAKTVWTSASGKVKIAVVDDLVFALDADNNQLTQCSVRVALNVENHWFVPVSNQTGVCSLGRTKLCITVDSLPEIKSILSTELSDYISKESKVQELYDAAMNEFNPSLKSFIKTYGNWQKADAKEQVYAADVLRDWENKGEKFLSDRGL